MRLLFSNESRPPPPTPATMRKIIYYFSLLLLGTISGILIFGSWMVVFFSVYNLFFGPFVLFEIAFLSTAYVENPVTDGLVIGGVIGCIPTYLTAAAVAIWKPTTFRKAALISVLAMLAFLLGIFFLIETTNVSHIVFTPLAVVGDLPLIMILLVFFLVPSVFTGTSIFAIYRAVSSRLRLIKLP